VIGRTAPRRRVVLVLTESNQPGKIGHMGNIESSEFDERAGRAVASALLREFGRPIMPRVVVLFGSLASGRSRASSDVDLAIALDAPLRDQERERLETSIASALRRDTDLVDLLSAPSHLVSQVLRHGRVLIGACSPALGSIIAKMVSEREDIAPYQRRILEERVR